MKKTLISILLASAIPAFAQTAVVAPTAPTIPSMVTVSPNATSALASATTNRVFIDQSGDNPDVNVTQDGSGNIAGTALRPVYLRGIDQTVVTKQVGTSNTLYLELKNASSGAGEGGTVTIQQLGNSNTVDASCGVGAAGAAGTLSDGTSMGGSSGCKAVDINWKFTGNSNSLQWRASGADIKSAIDVTGNSNAFYIDVLGDKHTETIKVAGDTNTFHINQRGGSTAGHSTWIDLTGNSNSFTISQTGTVDNVLNIKSVSNSGTFNITQKN